MSKETLDEPKRHHRIKKLHQCDVSEEGLDIYEDNADGEDLTDTDNDELIQQVRNSNQQLQQDYSGPVIDIFKNEETQDEGVGFEDDDYAYRPDADGMSRLKTNTPADPMRSESRTRSLLDVETKEGVYHEAMNLMSTRCISRRAYRESQTPLVCIKNNPYGSNPPSYFLVKQEKPVPMPPLKAWRGYHGNVYFEPIGVKPAKYSPKDMQSPPLDRFSDMLRSIMQTRHPITNVGLDRRNVVSRASSRPSTRHSAYDKQIAILDRAAIFDTYNTTIAEDLMWIRGRESRGSLREEPSYMAHRRDPKLTYNKEKICKGSVAHKLYMEKRSLPYLTEHADHFIPPGMSHVNFSLGYNGQNGSIYSGYDTRLPPLESLRYNQPNGSLMHTSLDQIKMDSTDRQKSLVHFTK